MKNAARVEASSSPQLLSPFTCSLWLVVSICGFPAFNVGLQCGQQTWSPTPPLRCGSPTSKLIKFPRRDSQTCWKVSCAMSRQHPAWGSTEHWPQPSQPAGNRDLHQVNLLPSTASELHSRICHSPIPGMNYVSGS